MAEKVLLHTCCVVCAGYSIEKLIEMGFEPVLFWFNPNIFPPEEFDKRYFELKKYADKKNLTLIAPVQDAAGWYNAVANLENEPEGGKRCARCFEYRLLYTALEALKQNINLFTTTLTISPHKNSKLIFEIAKELARQYEVEFLEIDFKKQDGFLKTMQIAKQENFYRQNYCGCEFSL